MMPEPDNVVVVYLRRIDEKADRVIDDVRDIKFRVTTLTKGKLVSNAEDLVEARPDRIERRLDLVDLPH
jgi:hypothetical protein